MMRALLLVAGLLSAGAIPLGASAGETGESSFRSKALGAELAYSYYLPDGYADGRRYPVIYLLHGYGGTHRDWLKAGAMAATADRLIAHGGLRPSVVIMPAAGNRWYVNTPELGPAGMMADAIGRDLVAHVDATFRTLASRDGRALAGLSMGGYGALRLALAQPGDFAAAASLSGALFAGDESSPFANPLFASKLQRRLFGNAWGDPFDVERYRATNVFAMARNFASAGAAEPPALLITSGDDDDFGLHRGAMAAYVGLKAAGVPAELRITDGRHSWKVWRRELGGALRFVSRHLQGPR